MQEEMGMGRWRVGPLSLMALAVAAAGCAQPAPAVASEPVVASAPA